MADSAVLREKLIFSPRNASISEWTPSRILKIKISRDTKQLFRKPSLRRMPRLLSSPLLLSCFFCYLSFLVIFSFSTNYFSTPPGGMSKEKKSFTPFARCRHLNIASESLSISDPPRRSSRKCSHSGGSDFIQTRQESTSSSTKPLP